jgi:hypothetical protein
MTADLLLVATEAAALARWCFLLRRAVDGRMVRFPP